MNPDDSCGPRTPHTDRSWFQIVQRDPVDLLVTLSLVNLLTYPGDIELHRIIARTLAVLAFACPRFGRSASLWLIVALLNFGFQNISNWALCDNHRWLYTYWYLALAVAMRQQDPLQAIQLNARLLIGLVFLFATAKKLISTEYLTGGTFLFLLYFDGRFDDLSRVFADARLNPNELQSRMDKLEPVIQLPTVPAVELMADFFTWWTLAIEGLISLLFLLRPGTRVQMWGNAVLLIFIASVYPIAPVIGFGSILTILGLAQCRAEFRRTRACYVGMFVVLQLFEGGVMKQLGLMLFTAWRG
jgi:hypothetical protein